MYDEGSPKSQSSASSARKDRDLQETMMINSHQDTAPDREGSVPEQKKRIGRYQIERVLGTGSMGAVYLARDEMLDRPVAVKVPKFPEGSGEEVIKRFYREARSAAAISHPNICAIYDVGEDEGTHYIAMQYVEGHSLADYVGSRRQPQDEVARVVRKIAQAMHEAHGYDLVHRDLKPDNVMIDHRGEPVVMDFGLARRSGNEDVKITRDGAISGSPAYMSPEQLGGRVSDVDPRSDIYSLGVLFYEALTGELPFEGGGSIVTLITEVISKDPKSPDAHRRELDPRICAICMRAMARNPDDRFPTMQEFVAALDQFLIEYRAEPAVSDTRSREVAPAHEQIEIALDGDQDNPLKSVSAVDGVREDCRTVRLHLERREFQQAIDLLKRIAETRGVGTAKYAEWAARELPRIRSVSAASEEVSDDTAVVPELAPLEDREEDVLWQESPTDLTASAELLPRERSVAEEKSNRIAITLGVVLLVVVIAVTILVVVSL